MHGIAGGWRAFVPSKPRAPTLPLNPHPLRSKQLPVLVAGKEVEDYVVHEFIFGDDGKVRRVAGNSCLRCQTSFVECGPHAGQATDRLPLAHSIQMTAHYHWCDTKKHIDAFKP